MTTSKFTSRDRVAINAMVDPDVYAALMALAEETDQSMARVVRAVLREHLMR